MHFYTRRRFLAAAASATTVPYGFAGATPLAALASPISLPLWPSTPPGGGGPPPNPPDIEPPAPRSAIATPMLDIYRPACPNGAAVLVAPGGGYKHIVMRKEGLAAAEWLNSLGITAFVLTYRLPTEGWQSGALAPFQDAQRALRLMHSKANTFGLATNRLGVLGFSAGGHLMGMLATRPDWQTYTPLESLDTLTPHIACSLLAYPVVTLMPPYDTTQTHRSLLGPHPTLAQAQAWSVQTYVTEACPPFFLVQAADDPIANVANTAILQNACLEHHVPVTRYVLETGGHGFGLTQCFGHTPWATLAENWLHTQRFLL
ncbi:MAG: alpha/beta hydrolase [Acetobacter sp.]|nr:alpha/beta hydrolase [Acetobacter sp.]